MDGLTQAPQESELQPGTLSQTERALEQLDQMAMIEHRAAIRAAMKQELKRSATEMLREHEVHIRFLSIGCVIRVGCKEIAFEDRDKAMVELMDYVRDPHTATKKWDNKFNQ